MAISVKHLREVLRLNENGESHCFQKYIECNPIIELEVSQEFIDQINKIGSFSSEGHWIFESHRYKLIVKNK